MYNKGMNNNLREYTDRFTDFTKKVFQTLFFITAALNIVNRVTVMARNDETITLSIL